MNAVLQKRVAMISQFIRVLVPQGEARTRCSDYETRISHYGPQRNFEDENVNESTSSFYLCANPAFSFEQGARMMADSYGRAVCVLNSA